MVERSIAWMVADNHRRVRFRGVEKNQLGLSLRIAAINLRRLVNLGLEHDGEWVLGNVEARGPPCASVLRPKATVRRRCHPDPLGHGRSGSPQP